MNYLKGNHRCFSGELDFVIVPLREGGVRGQLCDFRIGVNCDIIESKWGGVRPFSWMSKGSVVSNAASPCVRRV